MEAHMINRILLLITFAFFASGCNAESRGSSTSNSDAVDHESVEEAFEFFSTAVSTKNVPLFFELTDPKGIHLVRKFTSGNLGGRGEELSELTDPRKMNEKFQIPIKGQTPFSIRIQFQELPIKSIAALSRRSMATDVESLTFDSWIPFLKASLQGAPEADERMPIILSSISGKYHVYAEAQIITDILVGGFAVFEMKNGKPKLVALIELL